MSAETWREPTPSECLAAAAPHWPELDASCAPVRLAGENLNLRVALADGAPAVLGDFQLPATLAFASRAMSQMQGVGLALDSEFEFIAASAPLVAELAIEEKGVATYLQDELKKKLKLG